MDFFTVPTATFRVLCVFFIIHHARRRILHVNVTAHPTAEWVVQQLREAFPFETAPRYMILDRDGKYGRVVPEKLTSWGVTLVRIAWRSPWQNIGPRPVAIPVGGAPRLCMQQWNTRHAG
jgi:hypothetical protein